MLSRATVFSAKLQNQQYKSLVSILSRCSSSTTPTPPTGSGPSEVGYQRPVRQEPGKVRLGFVPEEWFQFFYKKTGVTGPYTFGVGLATYLVSKEIYVLEHEFYNGLSLLILVIVAVKKLGPGISKWLDKEIDDYEASFNQGRVDEKSNLEKSIEAEKKEQWSAEGQLQLVEAKRENVLLQREAAYRERLMNVYDEIRKRLDYQVELENIQRRIAQKQMVSWTVRQVLSAITPDQQKQNLKKCIEDLALLAKAKA